MLSIGKIGGGQGDPRYYIDTVAKGAEDYYTGRGEAEGKWHGKGAALRGLSGTVGDDEFLGALSIEPGSLRKVLGFDLTFSAPKSVSLLYGIGDPRTSRIARDAHDEAVRQALGYLEREACWTRRRGGRERHRGQGLTVAMFRHRTSRAGDPQLHTHSVVANSTCVGDDWLALDGRSLYAHARTAGSLYQAALRHELTSTLGVDWEPVHNGVAEIAGFDRELLRAFSRRSEEIRNRVQALGYRSARAAELATLETRRAKDYNVPVDRLREEWRARAAKLGMGRDELDAVLTRRTAGPPCSPDANTAARQLAAADGITRTASTFDRRDVLRDWAEAHREGATVTQLEKLTDAWLSSPDTVRLEPGAGRQHVGGPRYSTPEMLELEQRLIEDATRHRGAGVGAVPRALVDEALANAPHITREQAALVQSVTASGDAVQVVCAAAGTGKTYALAVARDAWESNGTRVFGCALAARAAVELESLAGIDSTTIAHLRHDLRHGYGLPRGSVLIVDEAGMVGSRTIDQLARHTRETDSKLLLVGDDRQLPELDAGGAFRGLAERLGAAELRQVRRQEHAWDRDALKDLRRGRVDRWAEAYREHGRLVSRPTAAGIRTALVDDWWQTARGGECDAVMIAHRRADVAELNSLARDRMHADSQLSPDEIRAGGTAFAIGDRVIARLNDRRAGLVNGCRGEVVALDIDGGSVRLRIGPEVECDVPGPYLEEGWLHHAYAITAHAAQGATVDRAFVLGSDELYREWGYTALSRHRQEARFYVVSPGSVERALPGLEPDPDPLSEDVIGMLSYSRRKELAVDVLERGYRALTGNNEPAARAQDRPDPTASHERAIRQRLDDLRQQRHAVPVWRRAQRSELDRLIASQRNAHEHWLSQAHRSTIAAPNLATPDHGGLRSDDRACRNALVSPCYGLTARLGPTPVGLDGRDIWYRAAVELLSPGPSVAAGPEPAPTISDVGLEL